MKALKYSPSFFLVATLLALFFASTPQTEAAFTNTLTWAGTTNTNITASNNWSASPAYSGANGFTLTSFGIQYVYTNSYSQLNSSQTFSYMGSNAQSYGVTFAGLPDKSRRSMPARSPMARGGSSFGRRRGAGRRVARTAELSASLKLLFVR
jgi:hypothetical protein